jgi:hypothetical protein
MYIPFTNGLPSFSHHQDTNLDHLHCAFGSIFPLVKKLGRKQSSEPQLEVIGL